jgi:predicted nucleic acid-binding protein
LVTVFVDTSVLYAVVDRTDPDHALVSREFNALAGRPLLTHAYVVLEAAALVDRRLGRHIARRLLNDVLSPIEVVYVDERTHIAATGAYLTTGRRGASLVDFTSFEVMRAHDITCAFALDRDFERAGFDVIPA